MRIAISIRGEVRTWGVCKHGILSAIKKWALSHDVAVFFDSWESKGNVVAKEEIQADLISTNAILGGVFTHVQNTQEEGHLSYLRLNYLSLISRKRYELDTGSEFDLVFLCRPDIVLVGDPLIGIDDRLLFWGVNYFFDQKSQNAIQTFQQTETFDFTELKKCSRFRPSQSITNFVDDIAVIGPSALIDLYQEAYLESKHGRLFPRAHHTVGAFLRQLNVKVGLAPWCEILRDGIFYTPEFFKFNQLYQLDPLIESNETRDALLELKRVLAAVNTNVIP